MDSKTINKPEQTHRGLLDERKRDRGDVKKQDGIKSKGDGANLKVARKILPNQGDVLVVNKVTKIPKPINLSKIDKVNDKTKKQNEVRPKLTADASKIDSEAEKMSIVKTSEINAAVNRTKVGERNVSEKVNLKPKAINTQGKDIKNAVKADLKTDYLKNQLSLESAPKAITVDTGKTNNNKVNSDEVKKEKETINQRKPLIKTVKSKNDDKVYKAVTFTEMKRTKPTVLEINMPNIQAKKKTKLVDKNLEAKPASLQGTNKSTSKLNIKSTTYGRRHRLTERTKRKKLNRCISSPDKFKKVDSPPTEVAKWAPSCLNAHTKPYYEAWVDTTLAAISKISKKDRLFLEKQNIIKSFQKSLELGIESPDLIHENYKDECYTGKIAIKQKNMSKRTRQPLITPLIDINK